MLNFSEAVELAREGKKIRRKGWNNDVLKGYFVTLGKTPQKIDYLFLNRPTGGDPMPWVAISMKDLLTNDWIAE